jgi:hypothetical protein
MEIKDIFFTFFLSFIGHFLFAQEDTTSIRLYGNKNCQAQIEEIGKYKQKISPILYKVG